MTLRDSVYDAEKSALRGSDIARLLSGIVEPRIHSMAPSTPTDAALFGDKSTALVLHSGHWSAFIKKNNKVLFFDSHGRTLKEAIPKMRRYEASRKVESSTIKLQQDKADVRTCGYHCAVRLWKRDLGTTQYIKWLKHGFLNPDISVSLLCMMSLERNL